MGRDERRRGERGLWSPGGEGAGWGIDPPAPTVVSWVVDVPTLPAGTLQAQGDPSTEKPGSGTRSLGWHQQVPKGCGQDISSWLGTGLFVFCLLRQTRIKPTVQRGAGGPKAGGDPCPGRMDGHATAVHPYDGMLFGLKEEGNSDTQDEMGEP